MNYLILEFYNQRTHFVGYIKNLAMLELDEFKNFTGLIQFEKMFNGNAELVNNVVKDYNFKVLKNDFGVIYKLLSKKESKKNG